jgi:polar amino acid transport system substrate-binding protein
MKHRAVARWRVAPLCVGLCVVLGLSTVAGATAKGPITSRHSTPSISTLAEVPSIHKMLPPSNIKSGVLLFDTVPNAPWANVGTNGSVDSGVDIDLGKALAQVLGLKLNTVLVGSFATLTGGIASGRYDTFLGPLVDIGLKALQLDLVTWVTGTFYFLTQKSGSIDSVKGMCGTTVAVLTGTLSVQTVQGISSGECVPAGLKAIKELSFATGPEASIAVSSGRAAAYAEASATCSYQLTLPGGNAFRCIIPKASDKVAVVQTGFAVAANNPRLLAAMYAALGVVRQKGVYQQILTKWGLLGSAVNTFTIDKS